MDSPLSTVEIGSMPLERFATVLGRDRMRELNAGITAAKSAFAGRTIWNVNSTARGGGVAEMLTTLLACARGVGVDARWVVIAPEEKFFEITKRIHNRLHGFSGDGGPLADAERNAYEAALLPVGQALADLIGPRDLVILHDPQTAGLVPAIRALGVPVVWRCHVGVDAPNDLARETWRFLQPYVAHANRAVFSREAFAWEGLDTRLRAVITPTIDAFAPKNQSLDDSVVRAILAASGLCSAQDSGAPAQFTRIDGSTGDVRRRAEVVRERPLLPTDEYVLQVSRWDALKDPRGVIAGFATHIAPHNDVHLVYAGPATEAVADDPEAARVLDDARAQWAELPIATRARIHLALLPMADAEENAAIVNALQRAATVVVQKSLAEGFGLTVAEAMWKTRPVVASRIGGIHDQIEHGHTGMLLDDPTDLAAFGATVSGLIADRARAAAIGVAAHNRVRDRFLGPTSLLAYLHLLEQLL